MINIRELRKVYGEGNAQIAALDGISLTVQPGEIFGVLGQSGAGKSTLIRCVNQLETEATSALDPQTTRSILELLQDLNRRIGLTILLITHDMAVVKQICDRVAILKAGQIVEQGRVIDLAAQPSSLLAQEFFPRHNDYQPRPGTHLVTLAFQGEAAHRPIFSTLARQFEVDVRILSGSVETVGNHPVGQFQVEIAGAEAKQALEYLHRIGVEAR